MQLRKSGKGGNISPAVAWWKEQCWSQTGVGIFGSAALATHLGQVT